MDSGMTVEPKLGKPSRMSEIAKSFGTGLLAALITGIVGGLLLRLLMGIVAVVFPHMARGLTIQGVILLIMVGTGFTLANGIIYTYIHRFLPKGWFKSGLTFGFITLAIYGIPFFLSNPDNDLFGPQAPLAIAMFIVLFVLCGIMLAYLFQSIKAWTDKSLGRSKFIIGCFAVMIIPALIMTFGVIYEYATEMIPAIIVNLS